MVMTPELQASIEVDLEKLRSAGQEATLVEAPRPLVLYHGVPTLGEPRQVDVVVPIPEGYRAAMLDLAGLPVDCPLAGRVKGGSQGEFEMNGRTWRLYSYHPHSSWPGHEWNPQKHGFHTYLTYIVSWLRDLN